MIVFSAGMQKSGTGWYFNLTNRLLATHGGADTRELRERSRLLGAVVKEHNSSFGRPSTRRLAVLLLGGAGKPSFTVKLHAAPSSALQLLLRTHRAKATYCYRDLRDVALSVLDASAKFSDGQLGPRMTTIRSVDDAVHFAASLVPVWQAWTSTPGVLPVRYEDLRANPAREIERLAAFLDIELDGGDVESLLEQYPAGAAVSDPTDELHFNRGEAGRFLQSMSRRDLDVCNEVLGPALEEMGHELV